MDFLKQNGVLTDESLEFWGDISSYNDGLKEYLSSLDDKLNNLKFYFKTGDLENYGILAHSTKSEAKYLGFMNEAQIFLQHEMAGKGKDAEFIKANFKTLEDTITKIKNLLTTYFKENETKKIVIADDSNIILNFIEKKLKDQYQVLKAKDGNEALEIIKNDDLYAILLDLNMPSINGFQVLDYLKENDLFKKVPVVVITGDDTEETIKKAFSYPILDVLNKPFKEENIERILMNVDNYYQNK